MGDYDEDAERIDRDYIPEHATTAEDVKQALDDAGFPQAAQSDIQGWLADKSDGWDVADPGATNTASQVQSDLERATDGTVNPGRAQQIGEEIEQTITDARREASQNLTVGSDGTVRRPDGAPVGQFNNLREEARDDGIYYVNENSGQEFRAARYDR